MPRPKTLTHALTLRMTPAEHAALVTRAAGAPLGPAIVAAALGRDGPSPRAVTSAVRAIEAAAVRVAPMSARDHVSALDAWAAGLRGSSSKSPALRCLAELARLVRDA